MRGAERAIRYHDGVNEHRVMGRCRDLQVTGGAEYLVVETATGPLSLRLDTLLEIKSWH